MKSTVPFSKNIFIESMRQMRITGIISLIIMAALPIIRIADILSYIDKDDITITYTGIEWMPWIIMSFVLITPILMFQAFHFMDKRNSSDLYHSLPHKRSTLFISISAAVMTWVILSVLMTVIVSLIGALCFSKFMAFAYDSFFLFTLNTIVSCILVGGAITIAKCLSGTIFNGILLTGIILFVPRFLLTMFIEILETNPIFEGFMRNALTGNSLNIVVSIVFSMFGIENYDSSLSFIMISIPSMVYTLVLGLIYFVLGGIAFCKRHSETAAQSAPNKKLQAVYRILIALIFSSIIVAIIFQEYYIYTSHEHDILAYIVSYCAVIFVYFLYELITTKKLKNLIKAIPGLGIVAVLNFAIYFALCGAYNNATNFRPAPDEINSVTVLSEINSYYGSLSYNDYVLNEIDGLKCTDQEVIRDISSALDKNLKATKNNVHSLNNSDVSGGLYKTAVKINTNGQSKKRNVYLDFEQNSNLNKVICDSEDFREAWTTLPKFKDLLDVYAMSNVFYGRGNMLSDENNIEEIYNMFTDEMKSADFDKWYQFYSENKYSDYIFECRCFVDGVSYQMELQIYEDLAPKTFNKLSEISKEIQLSTLKSFNELMEKLEKTEGSFDGYLSFSTYDANKKANINASYDFTDSLEVLKAVMDTRSADYYEDSENEYGYIDIDFCLYGSTDADIYTTSYCFRFPIDDKGLEKIYDIDKNYDNLDVSVYYDETF